MAGKFDTLGNIAKAALNPGKAAVMLRKVQRRLFDPKGEVSQAGYADWLKENAVPMDAFLRQTFDPVFVEEANTFMAELKSHADRVLSEIPHDLGGGGGVPLLYLVTRLRKPDVVVETGVAAGFSSASFLSALEKNGSGHLYSSDFPYFRIRDPERFIGVVVPEALRSRWTLLIKGDGVNVPQILGQVGNIDILHYDSDKSYSGRQMVMAETLPRMSKGGIVIMDDIQDNPHFHDFVKEQGFNDYKVIAYEGKFIGYIQL